MYIIYIPQIFYAWMGLILWIRPISSVIPFLIWHQCHHSNTYRLFTISYSSAIHSAPLASVIMHLPSSEPLTGHNKNASPAASTWYPVSM